MGAVPTEVAIGLGVAQLVLTGLAIIAAIFSARASRASARTAAAQADIAADALRHARLAGLPFLVVDSPGLDVRDQRLQIQFRVAERGVAYGIQARVRGCPERGQPTGDTLVSSVRPAVRAIEKPMLLSVPVEQLLDGPNHWTVPWLQIEVVHHGPLGAEVRTRYEWSTEPRSRIWRLRSVSIDPKDGRPPLVHEIGLDLGDADEDAAAT
jgi:hypothetical protein